MARLIAFTGSMGVGKSTAIETLLPLVVGHYNIKFAQPLYDMQEFIYERIARAYTRPETFVKDRKLLQWLGTEWGRNSISLTLWGDLWEKEVNNAMENYPWATITCDDARFDNEAKRIKDMGGVLIRLTSDRNFDRITTANGIKGHASEAGVAEKYIDYTVENNGTIEEFQAALRKVYEQILGLAVTTSL